MEIEFINYVRSVNKKLRERLEESAAVAQILKGNTKYLEARIKVRLGLGLGDRGRRPQPLLVSEN